MAIRDFLDRVPEKFRDHVRQELQVGQEKREEAQASRAEVKLQQGNAPADVVAALRAIDRERARPQEPTRKSSLRRRQERGERLRQKIEARSHAQREKFRDQLRDWGHPNPDPPEIPRRLHAVASPMLRDSGGRKAWEFTMTLPRTVRTRLVRAALEPEPYQPQRPQRGRTLRVPHKQKLEGNRRYWERAGRRRWNHPAAIKTVAAFAVLWLMGQKCNRAGYARVTRGCARGLVCSILKYPGTDVHASISACFGNMEGTPGYVRALEGAGLFYSQQPPAGRLPARDVGPKGWAYKLYWWFPWITKQLPKNATPETREALARAESAHDAHEALEHPPPD